MSSRVSSTGSSRSSSRTSVRLRVARAAGRATAALSRRTGRGSGGVVGGRVILRLAPEAVRAMAASRDVLTVSGTNGKTTTTALLAAAMRADRPTDTNADGANTPPGLATTLSSGDAGTAVLEVDEGWLPWTIQQTAPSTVVLLNLSRDQLSRHHEVGKVATAWHSGVADVPVVVANADDPDIVWAASAAHTQVWVGAGLRWKDDSVVCPRCGGSCKHDEEHWACMSCELARPKPDWWLEGDDLVCASGRWPLRLPLPGHVNRANAALAAAAAASRGVDPAAAVEAFRSVSTVAGRYSVVDYHGRHTRLMLAKNPASWVEALDMVDGRDVPLVLTFNSEGVDGRDPSWLYDVAFDRLAGRRIVVTGRRATDLRVRLLLDDVTSDGAPTLTAALDALPAGEVDVVGNYTAFQEARKELARAT